MYTAPHYSHVIFDCLDGIFLHPCFHYSEVSQPSLRLYHQAPSPPPPTPRLALSVIGWGEETTDTSDLFSVIVAGQFNMDCEHSSCIQVIFPRCQTILVV